MRKAFLVLFIVIDLIVIAGAGAVLYFHFTEQKIPGLSASAPAPTPQATPTPAATTTPSTPAVARSTSSFLQPTPGTSLIEPPSGIRNIGFKYVNPKARQVFIRAEFTGWKAESMVRDPKGVWTFNAKLPPGEYAYAFTVDDRTFRDPANPRTKKIGTTQVSSIVVKPNSAPAKPAQ